MAVDEAPGIASAGLPGLEKPAAPAIPEQLRPKIPRLPAEWLIRAGIVLAALTIGVLLATQWDAVRSSRGWQITDDAYVRGDIIPLSAKVDGYVSEVAVDDFQLVKAGQLIVEIERNDYRASVSQAHEDWLAAVASIANLKARKDFQRAQIRQMQSAMAVTQADVERTRLETARQRNLLKTSYGTPQKVEQAVADEKRFAATLEKNKAELEGAQRQMTVLDTEEAQLQATAKAKHAVLELARNTLGYTWIVAPVDGLVGERGVRGGQYIHAGTQVISVVPLNNLWVIANYKETQLTHFEIGQKAEVTVDAFPDLAIRGTVVGIAPATGSQFALLPPDNATGNFTKVVQRLGVKIALEPDSRLAGKLRPGMSVVATIFTRLAPISRDRSPP